MINKSSRREFLQDSAVVAAAAVIPAVSVAAEGANAFASQWGTSFDRVWLGKAHHPGASAEKTQGTEDSFRDAVNG